MRDPEPIGAAVDAFLDKIGMPRAIDLDSLVSDWREIAGESLASKTTPVGLRAGELTLEVTDGVAASLLRYRLGEVMDRLTGQFGEGIVTRIRIRVAGGKKGF